MTKLLFAFDFDFTVIDEDSDHFILKCLAPDLLKATREKSAGGEQWTDICDWSIEELHKRGFSLEQMTCALRSIPFNPMMATVFEEIRKAGNDILIISDANTLYIDEISKEKGIHGHINHVITNPGSFDEKLGRLVIRRHTIEDKHSCSRCPPNLCKGRELSRFVEAASVANAGYDKIVYLGDGGNDFCPSSKMSSRDLCMPRRGHRFSEMLKDVGNRGQIKASISEWESAADVLNAIRPLFSK